MWLEARSAYSLEKWNIQNGGGGGGGGAGEGELILTGGGCSFYCCG